MRLSEPLLIAILAILTLSACTEAPTQQVSEASNSIFTDSLHLADFRRLILAHYDRPIAITEERLDKILALDSFQLRTLLLNTGNGYYYDLKDHQFDSLLSTKLGISALPKYEPHMLRYDDTRSITRVYVDRRVFGRTDIEIIHVEKKDGHFIMLRAEVAVDESCFGTYPPTYQGDCLQILSKQEVMIEEQDYQEIGKRYYSHDLDRIAYYSHQSRMICDDFTYIVRRISEGGDKLTSISCAGEQSAVLLFYQDINKHFDGGH
ncbi:MAG: hypothetical protein AAFN81_10095 [Bacteroidota bacterium]